jgi:hypothetical protein
MVETLNKTIFIDYYSILLFFIVVTIYYGYGIYNSKWRDMGILFHGTAIADFKIASAN